jgi:hypothetical protein
MLEKKRIERTYKKVACAVLRELPPLIRRSTMALPAREEYSCGSLSPLGEGVCIHHPDREAKSGKTSGNHVGPLQGRLRTHGAKLFMTLEDLAKVKTVYGKRYGEREQPGPSEKRPEK